MSEKLTHKKSLKSKKPSAVSYFSCLGFPYWEDISLVTLEPRTPESKATPGEVH